MSPLRARYAVAATALAGLVLGLVPTVAGAAVAGTANPGVGETLRARSAPSTTASIVTQYAHGAALSIVCKATGTAVNGNTQWDKLSNNAYVSHAFVSSSATIPSCSAPPPPAASPQGRVNLPATDNLKVRSTPSTSGAIVGQLTGGTTHTITCKATGTSVNGVTQWDKIGSGYVSHAYITMTNSAAIPACGATPPPPPPPPPASSQRQGIIDRADYWYRASNGQISGVAGFGRNVNATAKEPPPGTKSYRRDCSGLIAMAWQVADQPGSTYLSNAAYSKAVNVTNLQAGDYLVTNGHVTLFERWVNKSAWTYIAYDFGGGTGGAGPMEHKQYQLTGVSGTQAKRVNDSRQYTAYKSVKATS